MAKENRDYTPLRLVLVYIALMAMLIAQISLVFADLGTIGRALILFITTIMVLLIATFFMGLHAYSAMVRLFASVSIVWLIIMFALTMSDYATR